MVCCPGLETPQTTQDSVVPYELPSHPLRRAHSFRSAAGCSLPAQPSSRCLSPPGKAEPCPIAASPGVAAGGCRRPGA